MGRLLNRLVTNKSAVRLTHGISEYLNTVGQYFGRRKPATRTVEFVPLEHVHGQGLEPVCSLRFGKYPMSYNGCEVIATYNALLTLGCPIPLAEVSEEYQRRGIFLAGAWGTHVEAIPQFFRQRGFSVETLYASDVRDGAVEYDKAFAGMTAAVFSFWNSAKKLTRGVHTVALEHAGPGIAIYNLHSMDQRENRDYGSIGEWIGQTDILPILLVTIGKEEKQ